MSFYSVRFDHVTVGLAFDRGEQTRLAKVYSVVACRNLEVEGWLIPSALLRVGAAGLVQKREQDMETFSKLRTPSDSPSSAASEARDNIGSALERGKANVAEAASAAASDVAGEMRILRADVAKLQATLGTFASTVGKQTGLAAKDVGSTVAEQVSTMASEVAQGGADIAASATAQAKTFASELEAMARKNPLGTLAGTLLVGVVIGMMSRGNRS
jgi:ElaB/YqjD/DUF883 family membrane-anchored ribosome-binding protein